MTAQPLRARPDRQLSGLVPLQRLRPVRSLAHLYAAQPVLRGAEVAPQYWQIPKD